MKHTHVVVTGASRGIGAAIAIELARAGMTVGCASRSGGLPDLSNAPDVNVDNLIAIKTDVTQPDALREAIETFISATGQLPTGLVNNAGIHTTAASHELSRQAFREMMDANALSVLEGSQAIYPHLLKAGGGLIINIGSFFDRLGIKKNLAYCASKAAVGAITRCLAVEWARHDIQVLNIAPGYILTDLNREAIESGPLGKFLAKRIPRGVPGQAEEIGQLVTSLFQLNSRFMTGETIYIDGGQSLTD